MCYYAYFGCGVQVFNLVWLENFNDEEGKEMVKRRVRLTFKENPVPKALRGMLKDPEFAFHVDVRTACAAFAATYRLHVGHEAVVCARHANRSLWNGIKDEWHDCVSCEQPCFPRQWWPQG